MQKHWDYYKPFRKKVSCYNCDSGKINRSIHSISESKDVLKIQEESRAAAKNYYQALRILEQDGPFCYLL